MEKERCCEGNAATAADLKTGQKALISELGRGRCFRAKMLGLGVRPGAEMEMLAIHGQGPCVLQIGRRRIMLGQEMLSGIYLKGEKDDKTGIKTVFDET